MRVSGERRQQLDVKERCAQAALAAGFRETGAVVD
jgi:hypothetical protein